MPRLTRRKRPRPGWEKTTKYLYYRCVRLHGKPREVAFGMALGLLVGFSPTMGLQMVIAVVLAALLGQNKLAAALGVWVTNPLSAPLIYSLTYSVGAWFLGMPLRPPEGFWHAMTDLGNLTHHIFGPLWVGGFVVGIPVAALGWWITYEAVIAYRLKVKHRKANRMHRWRWSPHQGWYRESLASPSHGPSDTTGAHDSASGGSHG